MKDRIIVYIRRQNMINARKDNYKILFVFTYIFVKI